MNEVLKAALDAAKSKEHHYALVAKGSSIVDLLVSKLPIKDADVQVSKKKYGGNAVVRGKCQGQGDEFVFQVQKKPILEDRQLKSFILAATKLSANARFEVATVGGLTGDGDAADGSKPDKLAKRREQFAAALQSPKLDSSDFILLSLKMLKELLGEKHADALNAVSQQYYKQDYAAAIGGLKKLAAESKEQLGGELSSLIVEKSNGLRDNPAENQSRRFYETRVANLLEEDAAKSETYLASMEGMRRAMSDRFKKALNGRVLPVDKITGPKDVEKLLGAICGLNDNIEMGLKKDSPKYQAKDRVERPGADKSLSRNEGIMKANAPNFADMVADKNMTGRVPDKNAIKEGTKDGYSASNKATPVVASISGTTFTLVALLEGFMEANKADKNLGRGVNDIVKAFMGFYIKKGFHSYGEMMDVLKEKNIQEIFAKYRVSVDVSLPEDAMKKATDEAEAYAKGTSLKSAMHDELKSRRPEIEPEPDLPPSALSKNTASKNTASKDTASKNTASKDASPKDAAPKLSKDSLVRLMQITGKLQTFTDKPGKYWTFKGEKEMEASVTQITQLFGDKAFRKAGLANTIEIYDDLKGLLAPEKPVNPKEGLIRLIRSTGKLQTFTGKPGKYWTFNGPTEMDAAVLQITQLFGDKAFRKAGLANTIEIYDELKSLLE